jgi:UDP-3-O-[3-hydroxymyristoyl] glucosamine N-acyltransferase
VVLGDDVELGANIAIDRGSTGDILIVQARIVVLVKVGIAGAAMLGDSVQVGGQAAIGGHISLRQGARIGAQADVMSDVPAGVEVVGSPTQPRRKCFRQVAFLRRMGRRAP